MTSNRNVGKGSKPRPTNKKQFDVKYDRINWNIPNARFCPYCGEKLEPIVYTDANSAVTCKNITCQKGL